MQSTITKTQAYSASVKLKGTYTVRIPAHNEHEAMIMASQMCAEADFGKLALADICSIKTHDIIHNNTNTIYLMNVIVEGYYPVKDIIAPDKQSAKSYAFDKAMKTSFGLLTNILILDTYCDKILLLKRIPEAANA